MNRSFLTDLIRTVSDRGRKLVGMAPAPPPGESDLLALADALLSGRGEASGVAVASELLEAYGGAEPAVRQAFLLALVNGFGPDAARLQRALDRYAQDPSPRNAAGLHASAEPRRQALIRRLNLAPGGTHALVRMREDLLDAMTQTPDLAVLDEDFVHLFSSWFNRGFLVLERIDWSTPANILEKIIRYEAVHAIAGWDDLRRRIEPADRRCFAFFHPALVDEPLIFVEVALTAEVPAAIAPLLADVRPVLPAEQATTAVFYSISNCQPGLRGITFGSFLIKQVVEELTRERPKLSTFVTLSPVPGFARWLDRERRAETSRALDEATRAALAPLDMPDWANSTAGRAAVEPALATLAAYYFLRAKTSEQRPVDPVARFHLGNGARLERINTGADLSEKGLREAHGLMVNYRYILDDIEKNHESYARSGEVVCAAAVRRRLPAHAGAGDLAPAS